MTTEATENSTFTAYTHMYNIWLVDRQVRSYMTLILKFSWIYWEFYCTLVYIRIYDRVYVLNITRYPRVCLLYEFASFTHSGLPTTKILQFTGLK